MLYFWLIWLIPIQIHAKYKSFPWNPPDFMNSGFSTTKSCIFHQNQYRWTRSTTECCIFGSFDSFQYRYMLNISPYHEIHQISWNLPDFMKSAGFHEIHHEICRISWNPPDFMKSVMKFGGFHEIRRISCISQMSQGPMVLFFLCGMMSFQKFNIFVWSNLLDMQF